jgi:hypothetical protein
MPTPRENETQDEFVNRCIPKVINDGTTNDPQQAYAICISIYERNNKTNIKNGNSKHQKRQT